MDKGLAVSIIAGVFGVCALALFLFLFLGTLPIEEEERSAMLTLENTASNSAAVDIYVLDGGEWDLLYAIVPANGTVTVEIEWFDDEKDRITVFAVYTYDFNETIFRYDLGDGEWRVVVLI